MRLLLARHGQTDWNADGCIQGEADTPLNGAGRVQAAELDRRVAESGIHINRLYASPKHRAFETAEIAGRPLDLVPVPVEEIREVSFGVWEGNTWAEVAEGWGELYQHYQNDLRSVCPPGGESYGDLLERVPPALDILRSIGDGNALVVCHSAVIKAVLCNRAGQPFDAANMRRFDVGNGDWLDPDGEELP